jgi:hypothetical protein
MLESELMKPKLSDFDFIGRHARWIPAFAGMTNKSQWVPVMPDLIRHPVNHGVVLSQQIAQFR